MHRQKKPRSQAGLPAGYSIGLVFVIRAIEGDVGFRHLHGTQKFAVASHPNQTGPRNTGPVIKDSGFTNRTLKSVGLKYVALTAFLKILEATLRHFNRSYIAVAFVEIAFRRWPFFVSAN